MQGYRDRTHAGEVLAAELAGTVGDDAVVLGVPRGGLPVAEAVADALGAPLDVAVARKIGAPSNPEFAVGAVSADGEAVWDETALRRYGIAVEEVVAEAHAQAAEVRRRVDTYRRGRPGVPLEGREVIVVDDGVATGWTTGAVLAWVRRSGAARVVLAVPVGPKSGLERLAGIADEVVCPLRPRSFMAVGQWYEDFHQLTDGEVIDILDRHA